MCNRFHICITKEEYKRNKSITRVDTSLSVFWQSLETLGPHGLDVGGPVKIVECVLNLVAIDHQVGVELY